jgi:hypothetical protein
MKEQVYLFCPHQQEGHNLYDSSFLLSELPDMARKGVRGIVEEALKMVSSKRVVNAGRVLAQTFYPRCKCLHSPHRDANLLRLRPINKGNHLWTHLQPLAEEHV